MLSLHPLIDVCLADQSTLDVVEADGTPISYSSAVNRVPIHNGQRVSGSLMYHIE